MAKKEEKITFKSILNKVMEKSMNSLISVAAEEAEHLITWIKNLSNLGRKIRNLLTTVILFSAGLGVLGIGVALYIKEQFPNITDGVSHILVGITIISIAALHSKFSE
jgi:hypothetical protein